MIPLSEDEKGFLKRMLEVRGISFDKIEIAFTEADWESCYSDTEKRAKDAKSGCERCNLYVGFNALNVSTKR